MTAMAEALREAGVRTPDEELFQIAIEAWGKWPNADAGGARRDYVSARLAGSLAWALWKRWDERQIVMAIGKLLHEAKDAIEAAQPKKKRNGGGQIRLSTQLVDAPAVTPPNAGASRRSKEATAGKTPSVEPPPAPSTRPGLIEAKRQVTARLSALDTVSINGQAIRNVQVREARGWAMVNKITARFIELVTANMVDHWVIGQHMTDDIADEMLRRAREEA